MALFLAYLCGLLGLLFGASLLEQYLARRQTSHLLWGIAFLLFSAAMGIWFLRETFGLGELIYRLWYLAGVALAPVYLGTGVVYLMVPQQARKAIVGSLLGVTLLAVIIVFVAGLTTPDGCLAGLSELDCLHPDDSLASDNYLPSWTTVIVGLLNLYALLAILAGVFWALGSLGDGERRRREQAGSGAAADPAQASMAANLQNIRLGASMLWQNKDFWRRDQAVQRAASYLTITVGIIIAALGYYLGLSSSLLTLLLLLLAVLIIYGGFFADRETLPVNPKDQLRTSFQSFRATSVGALILRSQAGESVQQAPVQKATTQISPAGERNTEPAGPEEITDEDVRADGPTSPN